MIWKMHYDVLDIFHKRSATIVLAYLVQHEGLTLAEAVVKVFMVIDTVVFGGPPSTCQVAHNKTKFTNLIHQWGLDGDNVSDDDVDDDVDDGDENDNDGEILGERRSGRVAQQGIPAAADRVGEQVQQVLSDYHHCSDQKIMIKYWHCSFMAR